MSTHNTQKMLFLLPDKKHECSLSGDVGILTRVGSMTISYFSPPGEHVFLWFW